MFSFLTKFPKTELASPESEAKVLIPRQLTAIDIPLKWARYFVGNMFDQTDCMITYEDNQKYVKKMNKMLRKMQVSRMNVSNDQDLDIKLSSFIKEVDLMPNEHRIRKYFSNIRGLALCITGGYLTQNCFDSLLIPILRSFTRLQRLNIGLRNVKTLTNAKLELLSKEICINATHLESLTLSFDTNENITQECIVKVISRLTQQLLLLRKASFAFADTINDTSLIELANNTFPHLNKLTTFSLKIVQRRYPPEDTNVTDRGLDVIGDQICRHLDHLQDLRFSFEYRVDVTAKGIETLLTKIFKSLSGLRSLSLRFLDSKVDDNILIIITNWAKEKGDQIERAWLRFFGCRRITEERVKQTHKELSFIEDLEIYRSDESF